jgi:cytochrome P450
MTEIQSPPTIAYEPYDNDSRTNQFELYKQMRAQAPVFHTESDWWCVSRYTDVREVLMSPDRFSSEIVQVEAFGLPTSIDPNMDADQLGILLAVVADMPVPVAELLTGRVIVAADPPEHTRIRRIVNRGFTARRMEQLKPKIEAIVADLLTGIDEAESFELIGQLANEVPLRVIGDFLSADPADLPRIRHWVDVSMECSSGVLRGTPEAQAMLLEMLKEFGHYFVPRIEERRLDPRDDLISDLVRAEESETLTVTEAMLFLLSIMVAGSESTASLIGSAIVTLMQHPDQLALLRENPDLARDAVQETLRFRAPFQFYWRQATADTEIAGVTIPAGARVLVMPGSANMDPDQFPDPDRFDIARNMAKTPILTFGKGIHHCLGAHLAPLEATIALRGILPHLDRFELSNEPLNFPPSFITYGYQRVLLLAKKARPSLDAQIGDE